MTGRIIYTSMLILVMACNSKKLPDSMQNNSSSFTFNEKATLTGRYVKSILSKRGKGEDTGHYKIIVNDSLEVNLLPPYMKDAVRSKEEIEQFEGKRVTVTGIIVDATSFSEPSLENEPLTLDIPCFITIDSIHLAKE